MSVGDQFFIAFLSYSRKDTELAKLLIERLQDAKIAFDQDDIRGGEDWQRKIEDLINRANNFIFLTTHNALTSEFCRWKLD